MNTHDISTPPRLAMALRAGIPVGDAAFDAFMPAHLAAVSARFWTPLAVASCAAMWLDELSVGDVLDVGSGAGKFCIAAALTDRSSRRYIGLEHRADLVSAARALATAFGVADRVSFVHGAIDSAPIANAYYLFNPFGENVAPEHEHFDAAVELNASRYARDIASAEALLAGAPDGSHVLVYNGFGGRVPPSYEPIRIDYDLPNVLRLWVKLAGGHGPGRSPVKRSGARR